MQVFLVRPRGFCAGVARAIKTVELALEKFGPPLYVRHAIVHNQHVIDGLKEKGVIFVESLEDIPRGSRVVFSAHGVSPIIRKEAAARSLKVIDATCPLVSKVHLEAIRYAKQGYSIILVGHKGHVELEGTSGEAPSQTIIIENKDEVAGLKVIDPAKVIVLTQTTLSVDDTKSVIGALKEKFPRLIEPPQGDICYATQNRQDAVKYLSGFCDLVLVVGDPSSSNSNQLKEAAAQKGIKAYLIKDNSEINPEWLKDATAVGVTASASAPDHLVEQVVVFLQKQGAQKIQEIQKKQEDTQFPLPKEIDVGE
ncbi:MAG: 4-hydroxy-3-methylbut-2-enyl diphosphate reductase [Candidatus Kerfeldbacteria bacterium CG_4_10_14_0_8_um_filter_42_10]|uniref:4-hydroxy-3-methylbut-2-enyl diphosphate reductase n=1 Tax=Candidatus Kerfeldbacteria bacterium CG_4_10_14_0_8_um_filter_42_10 TaxID=2014248 RepID=A0A2M7RGS4_9BACT|nr:MAG: 4-hydroxy-3-methylbut-2-enyl diphosphate reductase [Candidatus Kerfeldbacteria bacterium CG_4_10_14_0_8_um_filter_42_10]